MKAALELYDSRVSEIAFSGSVAIVHFSHAYIHRSAGTPGQDAGTGWSQEAQLVLSEARHLGTSPGMPNTIADGYLEVGGIRHELIPLPFRRKGRAVLVLVFADGSQFEIQGEQPFIELGGDAKLVEDLP